MREGMDIGRFGYSDRAEGSHDDERQDTAGQAGIVAELDRKGSIVAQDLARLTGRQFNALDQGLNIGGFSVRVLENLTAEDEPIRQELANLAAAQDAPAEQAIVRRIAGLL